MSLEFLESHPTGAQTTPSSNGLGIALDSDRSALMVAATGLGKTVMMAALANHWPVGRVMMVSHRFELNDQARRTFENYCGEMVDFEQGMFEADQCRIDDRCRIVVASVQSLNSKRKGKYRMEKFDPNEFGLIMIDEAHRAVSPTYRRVVNYFLDGNPDCKLVGMTATPDRLDGVGLGHVFESVGCDLNIRWGIENGWLVPVKQSFVSIEGMDLSSVKSKANEMGESDFDKKQLSEIVENERVIHEMAYPIISITGDKQAIVFTVSVEQAKRLTEVLNRHKPNSAMTIDGSMPPSSPERKNKLKDFKSGKYQYFVNVDVATEGFDCRTVEYIVMCRPTKSRAAYTQRVGRGTRFLSETGIDGLDISAEDRKEIIRNSSKPYCTVLDFVGQAGRHSLVCTADILAGDNEPKEIIEEAKKIVKDKDFDGTVIEAMEKAREEHEKMLAARRARLVAKVDYKVEEIDIWSPMSWVPPRNVPGFEGDRPPSEKMRFALFKFGFSMQEVAQMNFAQAKSMISKCIERKERKLASIKQRKLLSKFGISASGMSFSDASIEIDKIAKNGWRRI
jgi:superfamily II DNA or RNA helicase